MSTAVARVSSASSGTRQEGCQAAFGRLTSVSASTLLYTRKHLHEQALTNKWRAQVLEDSSDPADAAAADTPAAGAAAAEPPPSKPPAAKDSLVQPHYSTYLGSSVLTVQCCSRTLHASLVARCLIRAVMQPANPLRIYFGPAKPLPSQPARLAPRGLDRYQYVQSLGLDLAQCPALMRDSYRDSTFSGLTTVLVCWSASAGPCSISDDI